MAALRVPAALRSALLGRQPQTLRASAQQRRWAQVLDVRFVATTRASRNIEEKYREKLDRKAREEGLQDVGELKAAYAGKIRELRKKDSVSVPGLDALLSDQTPPSPPRDQNTTTTTQQSQSQSTVSSSSSPTPPPPPPTSSSSTIKPLSTILDLPKARALPNKELSAIWRLRHASSPNSLCAVVPATTYAHLEATARKHPTFVLPVPRPDAGAEMHFLQWVFDAETRTATVLFTQLAEYKLRGEWAQPHTSVTHYFDAELAAREEGVVLMAGSVVEGRGASVADAQWLVMLVQRFYGAEALVGTGEKRKLLEAFGRGDGMGFSVEKLLEESEKLG